MGKINFFIVPRLAFGLYLLAAGGVLLNVQDTWKKILLVLTVGVCVWLRGLSLLAMFRRDGVGRGMHWREILYSLLSHILLFSSLFMLFNDQYVNPSPTNPLTDSLYFATDTLATVGKSEVKPATTFSKVLESLHNLDTYVLLLLVGYEIVFALRDIEGNGVSGSRGKA